jgi:hypothetical protein
MTQPEPAYRDNCPECLEGPFDPTGTRAEANSLVGDYACTDCGHTWRCWWNMSTFPPNGSPAGDARIGVRRGGDR